MKFSTALSLCVAPLAIAKAVNNVYPGRRDSLEVRANDKKESSNKGSSNDNLDEILLAQQLGAAEAAALLQEVIIVWVNNGGGAQTSIINSQVTVTQTQTVTAGVQETAQAGNAATQTVISGASTTVAATGATHTVNVGGPAGLVYSPDTIQAAIGDMVIFTFWSQNHTATQSAFAVPCKAIAGGMDSGFRPNANNSVNPPPQVAMQVMVDTPLWFYCRQAGHCGKGMTFSINPTANKTQAMFQAMAIAQNGTGSGGAITGNGGTASVSSGTSPSTATLSGSAATAAATAVGGASTGSTGSTVSGTGSLNSDGSCTCAVVCAVGSFPDVSQGINNFGGFGGGISSSMAEVV